VEGGKSKSENGDGVYFLLITTELQLKAQILRSLTFVRDDIDLAVDSGRVVPSGCHLDQRERSHLSKLRFAGNQNFFVSLQYMARYKSRSWKSTVFANWASEILPWFHERYSWVDTGVLVFTVKFQMKGLFFEIPHVRSG